VGDDADFQRAKSHGQQSHGGRKALQNVPGKWGRANNIHPKAAATQSQIQRKGRTLKPFTEVIVSRKVAVDNDFNNRGNQKKMPYHNTRGLQISKLPTEPCKNFEQTSTSRVFAKPNSTKTTSTGGEALEPHIGNGGLAMQETRGSHQQSLPELIQHIVQFNPQRSKRDIIYMAKSRKRQNRAERKQLQRGAKLLNPTSATRVLLCKRPGPATKIAAKIIQTRCPIHSATQQRGQH
jgi:hypothetical protein